MSVSFDKLLRDVLAEEIARALQPVHAMIAQLQANGAVVERLAAVLGQPVHAVKRGPGRPPKTASFVAAKPAGAPARRGRPVSASSGGVCAVMGCGRPARSKGYCAAHYQKFRMLERTGRLPSDWVADASPNSVKNVKLPRGRAGAKALAETKKR
jgi:hypothetical protein